MKRAWELKKKDTKNIFSLCLKMAWAEAKSQKKEMSGSPKQVKWARDIQKKMLAEIEAGIDLKDENSVFFLKKTTVRLNAATNGKFAKYRMNKENKIEKATMFFNDAVANIKAVSEAKWFIEHRYDQPQEYIIATFQF